MKYEDDISLVQVLQVGSDTSNVTEYRMGYDVSMLRVLYIQVRVLTETHGPMLNWRFGKEGRNERREEGAHALLRPPRSSWGHNREGATSTTSKTLA